MLNVYFDSLNFYCFHSLQNYKTLHQRLCDMYIDVILINKMTDHKLVQVFFPQKLYFPKSFVACSVRSSNDIAHCHLCDNVW